MPLWQPLHDLAIPAVDRPRLWAFQTELDFWTRQEDGRFVDPFRPRIEPDGYATAEEMRADREKHLAAVRHMIETMDVFVFTFGHTETWRHKKDGAILQLAPGVAGGEWTRKSMNSII